MANQQTLLHASPIFSGLIFVAGVICIGAGAIGMFWLSKIIPGIYHIMNQSGFAFMSNAMVFHLLWAVFFVSLFITGIKLLISALNKRTKDLVSGVTLYFLGASLIILGLFYLVFEQYAYGLIAIVSGALCIYLEGTTEIA